MKQVHSLNIETYRALETFFDNNADIVEKSPMLKEDVAGFRTRFTAMNDIVEKEQEEAQLTGAGIKAFKVNMSKRFLEIFSKLTAHAIRTENAALKEYCKTPLTTFTTASDDDFIKMGRKVIETMVTYAIPLEKHSVLADFRIQLASDIESIGKMKPLLKVYKSKSVVNTGNRNNGFDDLKEFVEKVLFISVHLMADSNPDFVKEYDIVATSRTPTVSPTRVSISIVDDTTGLPVSTISIEIPELSLTDKTDVNGKYVVKVGSKKELLIKATKEGYVSQEAKVPKILRGRVTDIEIRLKPEQKA